MKQKILKQKILLRNNVKVRGRGERTLIFAHGFGCDQNMWRFVVPAFEDEFRIVLFDYVGAGKSDLGAYSPERYSDLHGYAQDVLEVCAALDLKDAVVVGHSVSSSIGLLASIREPERFERLVLLCPSPYYINDPPDYIGGFERADIEGLLSMMEKNYLGWASILSPAMLNNPQHNPQRPDLTQELETSFCATDPEIARRFAEVTFYSDNRGDLPKVTVPSLIVQCSDDLIAPPAVGDYVHRHLPQSVLRVIEATGHCPHISHPEQTTRIIKDYLAKII